MTEAKRKVLSEEEQKIYRDKHSHIAPEVVKGTHPPSIKSDVYSTGVVFSQLYKNNKVKTVKELARKCLQDYVLRFSSSELLKMIQSFQKL